MTNWESNLGAGIIPDVGETTTMDFSLVGTAAEGAEDVFFRVEEE